MKLLKKLGTRESKRGHIDSWGLYECGYCKAQVERILPNNCKSCGCARERLIGAFSLKHGDNRKHIKPHLLYSVWANMKSRCTNDKAKVYKWYGGKGIKVCEEWHDYRNFKKWALANGYKQGLTIDRIDSDGDYCPENCQWITLSENSRKGNRSRWKKVKSGLRQGGLAWEARTSIPS